MTEEYPLFAWFENRGPARIVTLGAFEYGVRMFWNQNPNNAWWGVVHFEDRSVMVDSSKLFRNWELGNSVVAPDW